MYMVQGILCVLLCWVCRLIKSERLGESPSPSARRLCKTCIFKNESYRKKRGLGKLIRKIVLGNVLPNIFFFCLGLAKIVFQLDAVKFAIELILSKQRRSPKFRPHLLFWVSRLEKQAIGCVAFAKCKGTWILLVMARKSVLNEINGFNHKGHHIGDLTSQSRFKFCSPEKVDFLKVVRMVFWCGVVAFARSLARSLARSRFALKSSTCKQVYRKSYSTIKII